MRMHPTKPVMGQLSILSLALVLLAGCETKADPVAPIQTEGHALVAAAEMAATMGATMGATTSVEREVITLDVTLPFGPGVVPCVGERVNVSGEVPVRIHTTIDGRGGLHQMASYSWKDVVATGVASGDTWHTTAAQELYTTFNYELTDPFKPVPTPVLEGQPAVFHHVGAIRFLSDTNEPDLYVRHLVQTVVEPDGQVVIHKSVLELLECR